MSTTHAQSTDLSYPEDHGALLQTRVFFRWRNADAWPVEFVTQNVHQLLGYDPAQFTTGALVYANLVHPDDLGRVGEEVATFSASDATTRFKHEPYRVLHAKGHYIWVDDHTSIIRNAAGEITHYFGYLSADSTPHP